MHHFKGYSFVPQIVFVAILYFQIQPNYELRNT